MFSRFFSIFLISLLFVSGNLLAGDFVWKDPFRASSAYFNGSFQQTNAGSSDEVKSEGWFSGDHSYSGTRKKMIGAHQLFGAVTWGLWLATNIAGEKAMDELRPQMDLPALAYYAMNPSGNLPMFMALKYDNPGYLTFSDNPNYIRQNLPMFYLIRENSEWSAGSYGDRHKNLAKATTATYAIAATLALLAPSKEKVYDRGIDSVFFHKGLAILHLAAIAAMPALGERIEHEGRSGAGTMQTAGWAGFTALSVAIVTVYW